MTLASKYRPKDFDELIGQDSVSLSLKYALDKDKLTHAYLFSGLRGSGKTSSARIFARALLCELGPRAKPCGECEQCLASLANNHVDIIELDAASNRGIEEIKALIEQTKYAPVMARFKVFIIDEVHMITPQAANALLKTLEEPPAYVKFILATTDPLKLPATILSRTQHFRFRQIAINKIKTHLENILQKENISFESEAIKLIARSGGGSLRDTLSVLEQGIIYCEENITKSKISTMLGLLDPKKIEDFYKLILASDKEGVLLFLKEFEDYEAKNIIDEMVFYLKEAFFLKSALFDDALYEAFFLKLARASNMLKQSEDEGFVLCVLAFMLIEELKPKAEQKEQKEEKKEELLDTYELFLSKIYNRDYELGKLFAANTKLISKDANKLVIGTMARDEAALYLNKNFKLIKQIFINNFSDLELKFEKIQAKNAFDFKKEEKEEKIEEEKDLKAKEKEEKIKLLSRIFS